VPIPNFDSYLLFLIKNQYKNILKFSKMTSLLCFFTNMSFFESFVFYEIEMYSERV